MSNASSERTHMLQEGESGGGGERRLPSSALKRTVCDKFAIKNASIDKAAAGAAGADGAAATTTVATLAVY